MRELIEESLSIFSSGHTRVITSLKGEQVSTFGIGGALSCLYETRWLKDLILIQKILSERNLLSRALGNGSNIVFPDEGVLHSPIVKFLPLKHKIMLLESDGESCSLLDNDILFTDNDDTTFNEFLADMSASKANGEKYIFRLHAGASLMSLSRVLSTSGFHGLEFGAGIPGTIGGAVRMNAGAHGSDISNVIACVHCLDKNGEILSFMRSEIDFSYRKNSLSPEYFIIAVDVRLEHRDPEEVRFCREEALNYRKKTQPLTYPSAGSVFRNPEESGKSAGEILEQLGFKGKKCGGVGFSDIHANWIVKHEKKAFASEVLSLVNNARETVLKENGVSLLLEIIFWEP